MKKKIICLVVDTDLTNEQIESWECRVVLNPPDDSRDYGPEESVARNVRVLDSDG